MTLNQNLRYFLVYAWVVITLVLIGTPMDEYDGDVFTYYDKFAHAFIFGFFAFLVFNAKYQGNKKTIKKYFWQSLYLSLAFAALGEIIQTVVPGRTESFLDFVAGALGALLLLILSAFAYARKK